MKTHTETERQTDGNRDGVSGQSSSCRFSIFFSFRYKAGSSLKVRGLSVLGRLKEGDKLAR